MDDVTGGGPPGTGGGFDTTGLIPGPGQEAGRWVEQDDGTYRNTATDEISFSPRGGGQMNLPGFDIFDPPFNIGNPFNWGGGGVGDWVDQGNGTWRNTVTNEISYSPRG